MSFPFVLTFPAFSSVSSLSRTRLQKRLQKRQVRSVYLLSSFPWTVQIIAILISSFTHLLNKLSAWLLLNFCCYSQWLLRSHLPIFRGVCNIVNHNLLLESKLLWASSVWNVSGFAPNHSLIVASQLPYRLALVNSSTHRPWEPMRWWLLCQFFCSACHSFRSPDSTHLELGTLYTNLWKMKVKYLESFQNSCHEFPPNECIGKAWSPKMPLAMWLERDFAVSVLSL